jgi:hypothetical protein
MIISWKNGEEPIKTAKAYGFKITHESQLKIMWIPVSQVERIDKENKIAEVPDWLYDKKIDELFFGIKER